MAIGKSMPKLATSSLIKASLLVPKTLGLAMGLKTSLIADLWFHELGADIEDPALSTTVLEEETTTYTVVTGGTKRGGKKLVSSEGYSYTVKKASATTTTWRCSVRSTALWCRASVVERRGTFTLGVIPHCHPGDPGLLKKTVVRAEVYTEARTHAYKSATDIVEEKITSNLGEGDFNLPKLSNEIRAANRVRQKLRPSEPKDLNFEIDMEYLQFDEFLVGDVRVDDERHIIMATALQLDILRRAKRWFMDGTYKIRREPFYQLYSIHAFLQKGESIKQVPLGFVLMSRKRKVDYVAVLKKILEKLDGDVLVEGFVMDFEAASWEAVKEVFPGKQVKGCAFHWGQAVFRKVTDVGLRPTYNQREGVYIMIRKLMALTFLPAGHIPGTFDVFKTMATTPELQELMGYLERTWLNSSVWSVRQWSVYGQSVRTNNDVEGWHRRINGKSAKTNLQFYLLVPILRKEANLVSIKHQLVSEEQLTRYQRITFKRLQGQTEVLWQKYEEKAISTSEFLKAVGKMYAPPTETDRQ